MATYQARLPELLERAGDYVVIRGEEVAGICETFEAAMWMGHALYGLDGFMVKKITAVEPRVILVPRVV
jgi:hypothetical protein